VRAALLVSMLAIASPSFAQSRLEVGAGVTWTGGFDAGGADALLSRGATGATPLTLFQTSTRSQPAPGLVAHGAYFFSTHVGLDAAVEFSRPMLRTTISNDFENATGSEATLRISSYLFGGSIVYRFGSGRFVPFVRAGAGRLRQLDEPRLTLVTGTEVHAGGGVTMPVSAHLAARADAVASSREKSLTFDRKRQTLPVVSASLIYRF